MINVIQVEEFEKFTDSLDNIASAIENMPAPSGGGINYSTEEQDTGLKWIDGRTVYQKTIVIPSFSTTTSTGGMYYGSVNVASYFPDITNWSDTYMNAILDKSFITLADNTVRNLLCLDFQNNSNISLVFILANRSGAVTLTLQYVKGV